MHTADTGLGHTPPVAMYGANNEVCPSSYPGYAISFEAEVVLFPDHNYHNLFATMAKIVDATNQHPEENPSSCTPLCHI